MPSSVAQPRATGPIAAAHSTRRRLNFTRPTGAITAAVPQANTSVTGRLQALRQSSTLRRRSSGVAEAGGERAGAVAGDAGEQCAGEHGVRAAGCAVPVDEEQVHPAHLLDPLVLDRVEPDDLVAAVVGGVLLADQARGVVAGRLGGRSRRARRGCSPRRATPRPGLEAAAGSTRRPGEPMTQEQVLLGRAHAEAARSRS